MFFRKKDKNTYTDAELIEKYQQSSDKYYVGELYKRHAHLVLGICLHYLQDKAEAEDAVINIFEKLFQELIKNKVSNFKAWLCFVSRNHCISLLRKKNTAQQNQRELALLQQEDDQNVQDYMDEKKQVTELQLTYLEEAMTELNEQQQRCVRLFYLDHKSYAEIIVLTGYTLNEVKSFIQNGKRNLKILLTKKIAI
jgi:RNA polymerase sigma factor (sigma-70 family)